MRLDGGESAPGRRPVEDQGGVSAPGPAEVGDQSRARLTVGQSSIRKPKGMGQVISVYKIGHRKLRSGDVTILPGERLRWTREKK